MKFFIFESCSTYIYAVQIFIHLKFCFLHTFADQGAPSTLPRQSFPGMEISVQPENSYLPQSVETEKGNSQTGTTFDLQSDLSQ